jgi:peptidoglycan/LPS O-acetylase OafA/YrhL
MPALAVSVFLAMLVTGPLLTTHALWQYFTDPQTYRYARNLVFLTTNTLPGVVKADGEAITVNGALWTLSFEVLCYASLVIMSLSGILARRSCMIAVFAAVYAMNALLWYVPSLRAVIPDTTQAFVSLFVFFCAEHVSTGLQTSSLGQQGQRQPPLLQLRLHCLPALAPS